MQKIKNMMKQVRSANGEEGHAAVWGGGGLLTILVIVVLLILIF